MVAYRAVAQPERLRNLPFRFAFRHQPKHLLFGRRDPDRAKGLFKLLTGEQHSPTEHVLNRLGDLFTAQIMRQAGLNVVECHVQIEIPVGGLC